ncbi:MAG: YCF48-related protein, partial [Bacteroidota bacterium]
MDSHRMMTIKSILLSVIFIYSLHLHAQWNIRYIEPNGHDLYSINFCNPLNGLAAGESGTILSTRDGGLNWQQNNSGTSHHLRSIVISTNGECWAAGDSGTIIQSTDTATTWHPQTSTTGYNLLSISRYSDDILWICGAKGTLLHTITGGSYWQMQYSGTTHNLNSIFFFDLYNGCAVGDSG